MAIRDHVLHSGRFPEGDVTIGFHYDDVTLQATRVYGRATFLSTWQITFRWVVDGAIVFGPAQLTTLEQARNLNPQQQVQLSRDDEGGLRIPISVSVDLVV